MTLAYPDHRDWASLQIELHKGSNLIFRQGAVVLNLAFRPLTILGWKALDILNGSMFLQYWNGVGENLLNYNRVTETFRAGFVLVR